MTKRIVILGAGIGGISAANVLAKRLGRKHEILLIDQSDHYEFSPSYLWVMNGTRELAQITVPISRVARKGVAFRRSTVNAIDPVNRTVSTDTGVIEADRLLIALGATTHMSGLEDVATAGRLEFGDTQGEFDHLAYVPKHKVPGLLVAAGLAPDVGWVSVDRGTMQTKFPGVYAVGDCVGIPLANGKSLPKAGVFAHGQAETAAGNIADEIEGLAVSHHYTGHGQCFVEMGGVIASRGAGNFYAEPNPEVRLAMPGPWNHMGKVLFEKYWLNLMY